jgi:hypothetical protein
VEPLVRGASTDRAPFTALAGLLDLIAHYRKPPTSVPFFDVTIALLVLLFALALFALMVVVALADRLEKWWAARHAAAEPAATRTARRARRRPRAERDPRRAIVGPTRASSGRWRLRVRRARRGRRRRSSCGRRSSGLPCRPRPSSG